MQVFTYRDYETLSAFAAGKIVSFVKQKPRAVLCVGSGDTPVGTYRNLVKQQREGSVDFSRCVFIGLDEWVGMDASDEGSCQYSLAHELFIPLNAPAENVHLFNAKAADLQAECRKIDNVIEAHGGIDLMIVGVGMNGHIALNEPGTPFTLYSHVVNLDEITVQVGQKYFSRQTPLTQGITIGLQHLMNSKEVLLLANGKRKAPVVQRALEGLVTEQFPASIVQKHANAWVLLDEGAASELSI